ncbi:MAG TPA: YihY/virulence factor BrkB family protein [Xanthobacteraceae bacterium]|jgi:membrane protein|nr:YihY/virulence factor BrkB family protein [Xanthobacteraceae bacterium]
MGALKDNPGWRTIRIAMNAFYSFLAADGWAIASHIALSTLMSLFPFLIVVTSLAGFFGSKQLADEVAMILLEAWPHEVAAPIAREIHSVLTTVRGGALTLGVVFATYFASSGIEGLRIGLNRAYGVTETRVWWLLRLESVAYVLIGAVALLALAFLVVLGPLIVGAAVRAIPALAPFEGIVTFVRYAVTSVVLVVALLIAHLWLPAGRRRLGEVLPGITVTLALWLIAGIVFGRYLSEFANNYVTTYAGLASAMIALVFLYLTALIFLLGGELNAAIMRARSA